MIVLFTCCDSFVLVKKSITALVKSAATKSHEDTKNFAGNSSGPGTLFFGRESKAVLTSALVEIDFSRYARLSEHRRFVLW